MDESAFSRFDTEYTEVLLEWHRPWPRDTIPRVVEKVVGKLVPGLKSRSLYQSEV